jgi:hypothetical protein
MRSKDPLLQGRLERKSWFHDGVRRPDMYLATPLLTRPSIHRWEPGPSNRKARSSEHAGVSIARQSCERENYFSYSVLTTALR